MNRAILAAFLGANAVFCNASPAEIANSIFSGDGPRYTAVFGSPSALPGDRGYATVGLTYVNPRGGIAGAGGDGDLGFSYSFGDAVTGIGLQPSLSISSLDRPFAGSGSFGLAVSRMVYATPESSAYWGAAVTGLLPWGEDRAWRPRGSAYLTNEGGWLINDTYIPYEMTLGYAQEFRISRKGTITDGAFFGLGVGLFPGVSVSLSGTDTEQNMGIYTPIPWLGEASVMLGVVDVFDHVNRRQLSLTLQYGVSILGKEK